MFFRTVRRPTLAGVVNPTHDIIVVRFFAHSGQVRRERATHLRIFFADRMTCETAARFKQILAAILVTLLLRGSLAVKTVLPKVSGDGLQIVRAVRVIRETPEGRHLGAGTKSLRIFQPNRNPFLAELQSHVFQVWPDFLLILL